MSASTTGGPPQPAIGGLADVEDDISITSTIPEPDDREYEVEGVIYEERSNQGAMRYLVKWAGYNEMENTFEPATSFLDPSTLEDWGRKREAIHKGHKPEFEFDFEGWRIRKEAFELAKAKGKAERDARRKAKRRRLGIPVSPSSNESEWADAMDVHETNPITGLPFNRSRRRPSRDSDLENFKSEDDEPLYRLSERRKKETGSSRDASLSSTDSLMKDLRARATNQDRQNLAKGIHRSQGLSEKSLRKKLVQDPLKKRGSKKISIDLTQEPEQTPQEPGASTSASSVATTVRRTNSTDDMITRKVPRPSLVPLKAALSAAGMSAAIASPSRPSARAAAKPQLGPGKFARRTGNSLPQVRAKKDVMHNWSAKPKPRKILKPATGRAPSPEATLYKRLSTRRRAELRARNEPTPDRSTLDLRTPGQWFESEQETRKTPSYSTGVLLNSDGFDSLFVGNEEDVSEARQGEKSRFFVPSYTGFHKEADHPKLGTQTQDEERNEATYEFPMPSHRGFRDEPERGPERRLTKTGLWWDRGEVLVTIRLMDGIVGNVRLCGLKVRNIRGLIEMKKEDLIDVWFQNVLTIDEYKDQVRGRSNPVFSNGWIEAFESTRDACNELAEYLRSRNSAAVWNHPFENWAFVLYHRGLPDWKFLSEAFHGTPLRIAVRPALPYLPSLESESDAMPSALPHPPPPPPPYVGPAITSELDDGVASDSKSHLSTDAMAQLNVTDLQALFRDQFGINFKTLITLHGNQVAQKFCLIFPSGTEAECELFGHFLTQHGVSVFSNKCNTNNIKDVWQKFRAGEEAGIGGCVLIHEKFSYIDRLPDLARMLNKLYVFWCVSLEQPIPWDKQGRNIVRLFPHGGCILVTEDLIVNHTHKALQIVKWYRGYIKEKPPGNWKLVFRPGIREWLFCKAEETRDLRFLQIRQHITALIPEYPIGGHPNWWLKSDEIEEFDGYPDDTGQHYPIVSMRNIPKYGFRQENDDPKVPRGLTQEERNNDHLMEWFAGWCMCYNFEKYRKFTIVYGMPPHEPHTKQWHGIIFRTPEEFAALYKFKLGPDPGPQSTLPKDYWEELTPMFRAMLKEPAKADATQGVQAEVA